MFNKMLLEFTAWAQVINYMVLYIILTYQYEDKYLFYRKAFLFLFLLCYLNLQSSYNTRSIYMNCITPIFQLVRNYPFMFKINNCSKLRLLRTIKQTVTQSVSCRDKSASVYNCTLSTQNRLWLRWQ